MNRSLRLRFALYLFPVVLLVTLVVASGLSLQRYQAMTQSLEREVAGILESHAPALTELLWNLDRDNVLRVLSAMTNHPDITCTVVVDVWSGVRHGIPEPNCADVAIPGQRLVDWPLQLNGETVGKLTALFTHERVIDDLKYRLLADLTFLIALVVATLITVHVVFGRTVAQPLNKLLNSIYQVQGEGGVAHQQQRVDWHSEDELGRVITAYNHMLETVERHTKEVAAEKAATEQAYGALDQAHRQLRQTNQRLCDSIHYAQHIQKALLPSPQALGDAVAEIHICWEPLDVVGGDYFWLEQLEERSLLVVADCTGHGVPGAFMTLVTASALDRLLHDQRLHTPSALLVGLDRLVRQRLRQDQAHGESDDGLEAAVAIWDRARRRLIFGSAGLPLIIARVGGEIESQLGDRARLGYQSLPAVRAIREREFEIGPGDRCFLLTDGVVDQMGRTPRRLLGRRRLMAMISETCHHPLAEQMALLQAKLEQWRAGEPRRDDMTLIGFMPLAAEPQVSL